MTVESSRIQDLLESLRAELKEFDQTTYRESRWVRWHNTIQIVLRAGFGQDSEELRGYRSVSSWGRPIGGFSQEAIDAQAERRFAEMLTAIEGWLDALLFQFESLGFRSQIPIASEGPPPYIFVAHGRASKALQMTSEFLTALGCVPIIVEKMPSEGRSVNQQIEYWLDRCHGAVVLATRDDLIAGRVYARPNVHIEIGRLQERFPRRVVLLLGSNVTMPSNVAEIVHERFTRTNMSSAFIKIATEFRAFGFLKAAG